MIYEFRPLGNNSAVIAILRSSRMINKQDIKVTGIFKESKIFLFYAFLALDPSVCALPTPEHSVLGFPPLSPRY